MVKHKKEDRSDWVAVGCMSSSKDEEESDLPPVPAAAQSAYQIFSKEQSSVIKASMGSSFEFGALTKAVSAHWRGLDEVQRQVYVERAQEDMFRFNRESHLRDVAMMERSARLRREREELILDDHGGGRSTRASRRKQTQTQTQQSSRKQTQHSQRSSKKKRKQSRKALSDADREEFRSEDEESSSDNESAYGEEAEESSDEDSYDSNDSGLRKKKKRVVQVSAATLAKREKSRREKEEKEAYIAERQGDLRKDRAAQAKKRLEFLLKQSDIFRHFGEVKVDKTKYHRAAANINNNNSATEPSKRGNVSSIGENDPDELEQVDEHEATYLTAQPSTLGFGKMRPYQLEGLNWMIRLQENGVNGILADEMGLGKTLQSISILVYMHEYQQCNGPHLIVVPKSTLSNWINEFNRWAPMLNIVKFHGPKHDRETIAKDILQPGQRDEHRQWHVCVTTYEVCNMERNVINKFAWSYLIIDEAHRLKNEASAFSRTIRTFETKYRLLLTGTPLQNNLHELWALLNFLVPDVFASAEQFDEWFNLDIDDADEKNKLISQLHKILRPFMLRRLKVDVEKSLPPKHETILFTGMSAMQKKVYKDILMRNVDMLQVGSSGGGSGSRTAILNIVMQLRKCAGHPYLFPGVEDRTLPPLGEHLVENCGKLVLLDKLLKRLQELGHRVLLFTQMTRILDILEDYLVMRKFKYCRIDGNTDYEKREESIDAFNAPGSEKFMFLLSTRAGGLGINLQTADVVILYDSDWNPQADLQAQDRAHRIGQTKEVQVFRLVTEHTIEEKVVERAQQKLKLDAMVVQQGRLKEKDKLSRDDLLDAVRFGADKVFKSKDSSITDDDIDLILAAGKKKTQELNEKLKAADKGDMLDFKLDGGNFSAQTFEGVDYSKQDAVKVSQAQILGILDLGKRERRTVANYNEDQLFRQQIASQQVKRKERTKKENKLPKYLRLPRLDEWQMFDRDALYELQDEEEEAFRALPEEIQKLGKVKSTVDENKNELSEDSGGECKADEKKADESTPNDIDGEKSDDSNKLNNGMAEVSELPPLLSEEKQALKQKLLSEGFADWGRTHYNAFIKGSAKYGRDNYSKIAIDVGKPQIAIEDYASAFWDENFGKKRFSENIYERAVKSVEQGERKLKERKSLEKATRVLISLFDNPWIELEFIFTQCKDKMFTQDEDRHLLCWAHKYGYGQWDAVKMAIRRSPDFRFDYYLKSLPTDAIGKRCEQLMRAAEKEVEQMEKHARQSSSTEINEDENKDSLSSVVLPKFWEIKTMRRKQAEDEVAQERGQLEGKVEEIESQMEELQNRLRDLNQYSIELSGRSSSQSNEFPEDLLIDLANLVAKSGPTGVVSIANEFCSSHPGQVSKKLIYSTIEEIAKKEKREEEGDTKAVWYLLPEYLNLLSVNTLRFLRKQKQKNLDKKNSKKRKNEDNIENEEGAMGPDGEIVPFPEYDGSEEPRQCKKDFTLFCNGTRREVKSSLDRADRKDKNKVNSMLKEKWFALDNEERAVWKKWEKWDAKRYQRDMSIYEKAQSRKKKKSLQHDRNDDSERQSTSMMKIPKKKHTNNSFPSTENSLGGTSSPTFHIPKKKRTTL